jgi:hypothetical protein
MHAKVRRGWSLLRATRQLEVLAQLQPGSRKMATTKGLRYSGPQEASETVQLGYKLAPDHDAAVLEFALATSLHHDAITGERQQCAEPEYNIHHRRLGSVRRLEAIRTAKHAIACRACQTFVLHTVPCVYVHM